MKKSQSIRRTFAGMAITGAIFLSTAATPALAETSFSEDVFPIIQIRCLSCHEPGGAGYVASGFDMRTYEGLLKGTKYGPMIVPNDAGSSNLLTLIDERAEIHMPFNKKPLSRCEKATFREWIQQGAKDN